MGSNSLVVPQAPQAQLVPEISAAADANLSSHHLGEKSIILASGAGLTRRASSRELPRLSSISPNNHQMHRLVPVNSGDKQGRVKKFLIVEIGSDTKVGEKLPALPREKPQKRQELTGNTQNNQPRVPRTHTCGLSLSMLSIKEGEQVESVKVEGGKVEGGKVEGKQEKIETLACSKVGEKNVQSPETDPAEEAVGSGSDGESPVGDSDWEMIQSTKEPIGDGWEAISGLLDI